MRKIENNYYDIACSDLLCMQFLLDSGCYNQISVHAQQTAEKMLKSVMELAVPPDNDTERIMRGHNLRQIYDKIHAFLPDFELNRHELSSLKDYYYDTKYPGDNFTNVTQEECNDNLRIAYDVVAQVNEFRLGNGLKINQFIRDFCKPVPTGELETEAPELD